MSNVRILVLVVLLFATLAIVNCKNKNKNKDSKRILNKITKGMLKSHKRLIKKYCKTAWFVNNSEGERDRNELGFARWTNAVLKCSNIDEETIHMVACDKYCVNPVTCDQLSPKRYCNKPVFIDIKITIREGREKLMKIPVACQCVKCEKTNKTGRRQRRELEA